MNSIIKTIRFSKDLLEDVGPIIKKYNLNFTQFILNSINSYIREINYTEGMNKSFGAWMKTTHPELKNGINNYVRKMRKGRY